MITNAIESRDFRPLMLNLISSRRNLGEMSNKAIMITATESSNLVAIGVKGDINHQSISGAVAPMLKANLSLPAGICISDIHLLIGLGPWLLQQNYCDVLSISKSHEGRQAHMFSGRVHILHTIILVNAVTSNKVKVYEKRGGTHNRECIFHHFQRYLHYRSSARRVARIVGAIAYQHLRLAI